MPKSKLGYKLIKWRFGKEIEIPNEWNVQKFRHGIKLLVDYESNGSFEKLRDNVNLDQGKPFAWYVRATDLENKRHGLVAGNRYCDKKTYDWLKKTRLEGGELLITKRGEIGKLYFMPDVDIPTTLAPNLYLILLNEKLIPKFGYYWFKNELGNKEITRIDDSAVQGAIYKEPVKNCFVLFSPIDEQQKIADILATIDDLINSYDEAIDLTKKLKRGLMQKLLTRGIGHTKFKKVKWYHGKELEIPQEFNILTLLNSDIKIIDGDRGSEYPKNSDFLTSGYCIFLSAKNVTKNGFLFDECSFISQNKDELLRKGCISKGDIVITTRGTVGNIAYFDNSVPYENIRINSGMAIIRNLTKSVSQEFLYYFLKSQLTIRQLKSLTYGSAQPQLTIGLIYSLKLLLPPKSEQQKIADILATIDELINSYEETIDLTKKLKRGLMQKLLTGQIRVKI